VRRRPFRPPPTHPPARRLPLTAPLSSGIGGAGILWSASQAATNALFAFVGPGDINTLIVLGAINGVPFGAKFLADAILADIIDYDEFLTGDRSEATYM